MDSDTASCPECGQTDQGQTGEYPCGKCGLPTAHDKPQAQTKLLTDTAVRKAVEEFVEWINGPVGAPPCARVILRAVQSSRLEQSSEDHEDEYTEAIKAAWPTKTKRYELHDLAMKMVGNRHSKAALVDLVNWLLVEREKSRLTGEGGNV